MSTVSLFTLSIPPSENIIFPTRKMGDDDLLKKILQLGRTYGWSTAPEELYFGGKRELDKLRQRIAINANEINLVLISAHGDMIDGKPVLHCGIDDEESPNGLLDLEGLIDLLQEALKKVIILIDSCYVDVVDYRKSSTAPILLAAPNHPATARLGNGLLTECFKETLMEIDSHQTWGEILHAIKNKVESRSEEQQRPALRRHEVVPFLAETVSTKKSKKVQNLKADHLIIQLELKKELSKSLLKILENSDDIKPNTRYACRLLHNEKLTNEELNTIFSAIKSPDDFETPTTPLLLEDPICFTFYARALLYASKTNPQIKPRKVEDIRCALEEGLIEVEKRNDDLSQRLVSQVYDQLAGVRCNRHDWQEAINGFKKSEKLKKTLNDYTGEEMSRGQRALCHIARNELHTGEQVLLEGVSHCFKLIDSKSLPMNEVYSILSSIAYHSIKLAKLYKVIEPTQTKWRSFYKNATKSIKIIKELSRYSNISTELFDHLRDFLTFHYNKYNTTFHYAKDTDPIYQKLWKAYEEYNTNGTEEELNQLNKIIKDCIDRSWELRLDVLAIASERYYREDAHGSDLLKNVVGLINERAAFNLKHEPWLIEGNPTPINTNGWHNWGPLESKLKPLIVKKVSKTLNLTEQYLQTLFWSIGTIICISLRQDMKVFIQDLFKSAWKNHQEISMTLRPCYAFAHEAILLAKKTKHQHKWLEELTHNWLSLEFLKQAGYVNIDELIEQRNNPTHETYLTDDEQLKVIEQHRKIIQFLSSFINDATFQWQEITIDKELKGLQREFTHHESENEVSLYTCVVNVMGERIACSPLLFKLSEIRMPSSFKLKSEDQKLKLEITITDPNVLHAYTKEKIKFEYIVGEIS